MSDLSPHPVLQDARVWLDDDGYHVWFAHNCLDGKRVETMLPHPTWHREGTKVVPSIDCRACGCHSYFDLVTDAPEGKPMCGDCGHPEHKAECYDCIRYDLREVCGTPEGKP